MKAGGNGLEMVPSAVVERAGVHDMLCVAGDLCHSDAEMTCTQRQ